MRAIWGAFAGKTTIPSCRDEQVFLDRLKMRSVFIDSERTSFVKKIIVFKDGFARIEYFAHKRLLEESCRVFRDFPSLKKIKVVIESSHEQKRYSCEVRIGELERFTGVKFARLRKNKADWRRFIGSIDKPEVKRFARKYVTSTRMEVKQ